MMLHEGQYILPDGSMVEVISTPTGNWRLQRLDGTPLYYIAQGIIKHIDRTGDTARLVDCDLRVEDLQPVEESNNQAR